MDTTQPLPPRRPQALPRWLVVVASASLALGCDKAGAIKLGDPETVVRERMGSPTAVYRSRAAIEAARFGHFWFTNRNEPGAEPTHADLLPPVEGRALWFRFLTTAGTLVYLDADDRVSGVFSAGT